MVDVFFDDKFKNRVSKIKNSSFRVKLEKSISKIIDNPLIGKPMRYNRRGTREIYISPFRLSYFYDLNNNSIVILDLYHKDFQ